MRERRTMPLMKLVPAALVLVAIMATSAPATLLALQIGMEAPDFSLKTLSGEQKALAALKGEKLTVVVFWSTWSSKSEKVLARMQKLYDQYRPLGLVVVGINADGQKLAAPTLAAIASVRERLGLTYPLLLDDGLNTFHDYGVIALPTTVIIDPDRVIRYELSGYPLVRSEEMADFITAAVEGKKGAASPDKLLYQPGKNAVRFFNMGQSTLKSKRMADTAEGWFKKAAEADPSFVLPHLSLAGLYGARGDNGKALAEYREVLARDKSSAVALCESGLLMVKEGKIAEGAALFETARKTDETYPSCSAYEAYGLGKEGKLDKALPLFDEAEKANPRDYRQFVLKGELLEERKEWQKASESYRRALEEILPALSK